MAFWMINCKQYVELTSQSMDHSLSFWDKITMRMHQMLCPPCNLIREQFDTIRSACRLSAVDNSAIDTPHRLSDEACERMKQELLKVSRGRHA